jgi:FPC/CPF motif-containing protein YcgG
MPSERGGPVSQLAPQIPEPAAATRQQLASALSEMVAHPDYPCLGARSVFHRDRATVHVYDELAGAGVAEQLLADLRTFAAAVNPEQGFASLVATFRGPSVLDEEHFERLLWSQLEQIHMVDDATWNPAVSADPSDQHFAFSAGGTAYFIVGLHPRASRDARRTPAPTLVFNLHEQFESLRASGQFPRMRDKIRERDQHLQGSINPMVADHGETSEARQYSGRQVGPAWQAPFCPRAQERS